MRYTYFIGKTMHKYILFLTLFLTAIGSLAQEQRDSLQMDSIAMAGDTVEVVEDSIQVAEDSVKIAEDSTRIAEAAVEHPVKDTIVSDKKAVAQTVSWQYRADSIAMAYQKAFLILLQRRNSRLASPPYLNQLGVYSMRIAMPPTFYASSVLQQFNASDIDDCTDPQLIRMYMVNTALAKMYVRHPELVQQTDEQVKQSGTLRNDVHGSLTTETKLSDKVVNVNLESNMNDGMQLVTRRPNFWKINGNGSLQFSQNYFSENWFQGGNNNYTILAKGSININFDNKQNISWENRIDAELGYQTTGDTDTQRAARPTSNLLRLTTKLGYKAYKTLYYTTQVQASTQLVPQYQTNTETIISSFISPMNMTISVGLDYKFATKNNKFSGSVYVAPCSYNMRYVDRKSLASRYGIEKGRHAYHNFGPSININATWKITKDISWRTRIYWISNMSYTNIEWENNINFSINKYMSAQMQLYPKFDDSSKSYKGDCGFLMFKEWLSLGMNYSW